MDPKTFKIKKVSVLPDGTVYTKPTQTLPADVPRRVPAPPPNVPSGMKIIRVTATPRIKRVRERGVNGHWQFEEALCQRKQFGFIYLIHDVTNDRMYIGKKQYVGAGKLNKGQETDWRSYCSSCKELQKALIANGKQSFKFYVLEEYRLRGSLGYAETWSLMQVEALANRDKWYNGLVNKVSWNVNEGISQRHKRRLDAIVNGRVDTLPLFKGDEDYA